MAGRVPLKIIYLIVRLAAALAVLVVRRDLAKEAELLVLRHENAVLRRQVKRTRYEPADRVWFAALDGQHPGVVGQQLPRALGGRIRIQRQEPVQARDLADWMVDHQNGNLMLAARYPRGDGAALVLPGEPVGHAEPAGPFLFGGAIGATPGKIR